MTNNVKSYKKSMEKLKLPDPVFLPVDFRGSVLKTQKNIETRQTKTPVSQIFQIICRHSSLLMNSTEAVWGCSTLFIEYCWMYNYMGVSSDSWLTLSYILHNSLDKFRLVWIAASYKSEHANSFKAAYEQWGLLMTAHITLKSPSSCCWQLLPYPSGFTIWHNIWGP